MCHIFAGQNPENYAFETRSIRLMGHTTSIRLESKFWEVLEKISAYPDTGSISLTGGEPLLQTSFLEELLPV